MTGKYTITILGLLGAIAASLYFALSRPISLSEPKMEAHESTPSGKTTKPTSTFSHQSDVKDSPITYQPKLASPTSERIMTSLEVRNHPKNWLLALSEREAAWLDLQGYPTIAQEEMLGSASEETLWQLSQAGDLNASAHLLQRLAKRGVLEGDKKAISGVVSIGLSLGVQGGPAQAAKVVESFILLAKEIKSSPPLDAAQRESLAAIMHVFNRAVIVSLAHGDAPTYAAYNNYKMFGPLLQGFSETPTTSAEALYTFSDRNAERLTAGYQPHNMVPRPRNYLTISESVKVFIR